MGDQTNIQSFKHLYLAGEFYNNTGENRDIEKVFLKKIKRI